MEDIKLVSAEVKDIPGILILQDKYLLSNTPDEEKENGFVTTPFTIPQIEQIIKEDGLFVAKHNDKVVAYLFAGSWKYFSQWEIFNYMANRFNQKIFFKDILLTTQNSFQYGPICIDKPYRGSKLLYDIFEIMRKNLKTRYPVALTFINKINKRSLKAHTEKLNWKIIDEFDFNSNNFYTLAYDMNLSVTV